MTSEQPQRNSRIRRPVAELSLAAAPIAGHADPQERRGVTDRPMPVVIAETADTSQAELRRLQAELAKANAALTRAEEARTLAEADCALALAERRLTERQAHARQSRAEQDLRHLIAHHARDCEALRLHIVQQQMLIAELHSSAQPSMTELEQQIAALYASTSWRITAPLRAMRLAIRRVWHALRGERDA